MPAELLSHRGQELVGESASSPRAESLVKGAGENRRGTASSIAALIVHRPSPESETRPATSTDLVLQQCVGGQVQHQDAITLPRRHTIRTVPQVHVVLIVLSGYAQWRSLSICCGVRLLADVWRSGGWPAPLLMLP